MSRHLPAPTEGSILGAAPLHLLVSHVAWANRQLFGALREVDSFASQRGAGLIVREEEHRRVRARVVTVDRLRRETRLGEGGCSLSGGERQRLSIARALLKDAPIVLLDEATASVDASAEAELQRAIDELVKHKTVVMVAHRLRAVRRADAIVVLDRGRVVESGTDEELLARSGTYATLWREQERARGWRLAAAGR